VYFILKHQETSYNIHIHISEYTKAGFTIYNTKVYLRLTLCPAKLRTLPRATRACNTSLTHNISQ